MGDEPVRPYAADDCADEGHPRDEGVPAGTIDPDPDPARALDPWPDSDE